MARTFLDLQKIAKTKLWTSLKERCKKISGRLFLRASKYYDSCDTLPLKVFCEVISTGNYSLLAYRKGRPDPQKELEIWSEIIIEYSKLEGDNTAKERFEKIVTLNELKNSYNVLKAMVRFLYMISPSHKSLGGRATEIIGDLEKMGYKIDLTDSESYKKSLDTADRRMNSLITMIRMKENELQDKTEETDIDFDDLMALIQERYTVGDDLTVKRYVSMKKHIIKTQKRHDSKRRDNTARG